MTEREKFLGEIEAFLRESGMPPTIFGRKALNDTALVSEMREGRDLKFATVDKLRKFMTDYRRQHKSRPTSGAGRAKKAA